jgi:hypothetical protein
MIEQAVVTANEHSYYHSLGFLLGLECMRANVEQSILSKSD